MLTELTCNKACWLVSQVIYAAGPHPKKIRSFRISQAVAAPAPKYEHDYVSRGGWGVGGGGEERWRKTVRKYLTAKLVTSLILSRQD